MNRNDLKTVFDAHVRQGSRYMLCLSGGRELGGANEAELLRSYQQAQKSALTMEVNYKPAMVFDTTRDFNAQYEWQRQHGVGYAFISATLKGACARIYTGQQNEIDDRRRRLRRRRRKRMYGW